MASNFTPTYFEQPIVIFDTTEALNATTGSFVLYGGLSIASTYESTGLTTGAFVLHGGMGVQSNLNVGGTTTLYGANNIRGITTVLNSTESTATNNGALIVAGGVGIAKDLNVGGDATITGNLYVNGTTTSVNTTTVNVTDNTFLLNSGPAGSRDAGVVIQRYQVDNDTASGDVVAASEPVAFSGTAETGSTTTLLIMDANASAIANAYVNYWVKFTSGDAEDSVRQITAYDSITKEATLSSALPSAPDAGDSFELFNRNYVAQYYDEASNELVFGYTSDVTDITADIVSTGYADVRALNVFSTGLFATNSTLTNLVVSNVSSGSIAISSAALTDLTVSNTSTIANTFIGQATAGSLTVNGPSLLQGGLTAGTLLVTGESVLTGDVTAGALAVIGESILSGGALAGYLDVTGASLLQGGITAGSLFVTGESILNGNVTSGALAVTGASLLRGGLTAGTLYVTGPSILDLGLTAGSLYVTGDSVLSGNATAGALAVVGESILSGGALVGALTVTGASTLHGGLTAGTLSVTGESSFLGGATASSLYVPTQATLGSLFVSAGSIFNTVTAGTMMINTVDMTPSLGDIFKEQSFSAANNQASPAAITDFAFSNANVRCFDAVVSVSILTVDDLANKYAYYNLKGVQKNGAWVLNSSFVGDITGVTFSINNSGQLQYTSNATPNFVSNTIKFRALTTSI
jgi:hypothetical protein